MSWATQEQLHELTLSYKGSGSGRICVARRGLATLRVVRNLELLLSSELSYAVLTDSVQVYVPIIHDISVMTPAYGLHLVDFVASPIL